MVRAIPTDGGLPLSGPDEAERRLRLELRSARRYIRRYLALRMEDHAAISRLTAENIRLSRENQELHEECRRGGSR